MVCQSDRDESWLSDILDTVGNLGCLVRRRELEMKHPLVHSNLAFDLLKRSSPDVCAACAGELLFEASTTSIVYGRPVAVCDRECLEMLYAAWQPVKGRV